MNLNSIVKTGTAKDHWLLFACIILVFLTRMPWLNAGYGNDPDAWRVAFVGYRISESGIYSASRLPGFPVHELLASLLWGGGALVLNALTACISGIAVGFFALIVRTLRGQVFISATMFAFVPVVYVASASNLDYMWGATLVLAATYFVITGRFVMAGSMLGLAIGCRITSGAMLLPLGYLTIATTVTTISAKRTNLRNFASLVAMTFLIGILTQAPLYFRYGFSYLTTSGFSDVNKLSLSQVLQNATINVWGRLGFLALTTCMLMSILMSIDVMRRDHKLVIRLPDTYTVAILLALFVYSMLFVALPNKASYLIPLVPFVIFLISRSVKKPLFAVICVAVVLSSFVDIYSTGIGPGAIVRDHQTRILWMRFTGEVANIDASLPKPNVIVAGDWLPKLQARELPPNPNILREGIVFSLDSTAASNLLRAGYHLFYLPGQGIFVGSNGEFVPTADPIVATTIDEAYAKMGSIEGP